MSAIGQDFASIRYAGDDPQRYGFASGKQFAAEYEASARLHLLTDAVRIAPELLPHVAKAVSHVADRLRLADGIDAYVYADRQHQARSTLGGNGRPAVMLSSGIIELLSADELEFVIGHEVGHYLFNHHSYPKP